jgi:hypothetical protein
MKEAMFLRGEFSEERGWTHNAVQDLLKKLLTLVYDARWKNRLYGILCTVNMGDHNRASSQGYCLPSAYRICAHASLGSVLRWRLRGVEQQSDTDIASIESIDIFFDQNERFLHHLQSIWQKHRKSDHAGWGLINCVAPAEMRNAPPLQLADMLAWAKNRKYVFGDHVNLCNAVLHMADMSEYDIDYSYLVSRFGRIIEP